MSQGIQMMMRLHKQACKDVMVKNGGMGDPRYRALTGDALGDAIEKQKKFLTETVVDRAVEFVKFQKLVKERLINEGLLDDNVKIQKTYFITIRPDAAKITFPRFYELVSKFVQRGCFEWFELTFEQKSVDANNLGVGFHTHILAKMNQRSKGEVLRDTISTFKTCTADNCIQVDMVKTDKDLERTRNYITKYEAMDGHKEVTEEADKLWRASLNLRSLYTDTAELVPYNNLALPYQVQGESRHHVEF